MRNSKKNIKKNSKRSRNKKMKAGEPTKIHILYVLGYKDGENQIHMITMSKSIKNLHLSAIDIVENLDFDKIEFKQIFENNMVIDTIELDNANTSHSWQKVSFIEIHRLVENKEYSKIIDQFDEMLLHYVFDKKSIITGVIGAVYSNEVDSNDGKITTDNIDNSIELFNMYNPIDSQLDVIENNLSISNITADDPRVQTDKEQKVVPAKVKSAYSPCPKDLLDSRYSWKNWSDVEEAGCYVKDLIDEGKIPYRFIHNTNGARRLMPYASTFLDGLTRCRILNAINPQEVLNDGKWKFFLDDYKDCNEENKSRNLIKYLIENGITIPILLEHNYDVPYLLENGITLKQIIDSGVPIRSLLYTYEVNLSEIINIGLSLEQILKNGFTISELKEILQLYPDALVLIKKNGKITLKELIKDLGYKLKDLIGVYSVQELWDNGIRDFDALISAGVYKPGLLALKGLTIKEYTDLNKKLDNRKISLSELINKFPLSETFYWIADGNIENISLRDLIVAYKNNIPELITVAKPEFLFATGLFTYGQLKQWLKNDITGKHNKEFLNLAKKCNKSFFWRETNLDCKYQPDTFPRPFQPLPSGKAVNHTERYPTDKKDDKKKK